MSSNSSPKNTLFLENLPKIISSLFFDLLLGPPLRPAALRRLLPLVVELRPKGLVVALGLAEVLGPPLRLRLAALRSAARYSLGPARASPAGSGLTATAAHR
ncbi:hypothetical protein SapgrDRAFT_2582 [Saprospira grandis DSM 2844]|uniref:Uncharacterized protein n=1 Tax=Saprospira grandis DSM 2844 TaxID=694433 RepID=J1I650_9BACT|nr:hypothetical protein SapgrDRAFT_2582 [Saprospira grandis DSM 2844]